MDLKALLQQISQVYQKLSLRQKIVIASSVVVVVGFLVFLTLFKSKTNTYAGYSVLFENISANDSALIIDQLTKDGVDYKLVNEGTILVPNADVYKERISVATLGIPKESKIGFEIFDKQEFGATDVEQRVKYQRALEGELARTIESLAPITKATIRIAFPKETVFTERQSPPTASVVLELKSGSSLGAKQIFGIKNLVAASVTNLTLENVKIVNQDGIALGEEDGFDSEMIIQQIRYKKEFENNYEQKIINVLAPIVGGTNKVVAKVNIEFDFDKKDSQSEVYDPNNVIRSESNVEEKRQGRTKNDIQGVPGAVSNIGPVEGLDDNKLEEQYSKSSQQTNYEISKKITNVKGQFATILRVSAAVVVDGIYQNKKDENGNLLDEFEYISLNDSQKASITNLIKQAIGFNASRGDEVTLDNFEFKNLTRVSPTQKVNGFMQDYIIPFMPLFKYIFAILLLYLFYKKVIVVFMQKMLEDIKEDEDDLGIDHLENLEIDDEDTLEKFKAAKKKVEEQLGLTGDFNEDELKYDVLLEKMKGIVQERSEEISILLQDMVKNDSDFNVRKEL
ncbi:flagellar basal-body MS-ring/collar protein FliF [Campylobacter pinnipediorum]|uniref:flagellar basal-body MS-ring/collar protein FliF n=1 Tax=Campylobacter pinnipediorum TaxID=1965231 RepID=UPI00084D7720|nr:flagellar basal-body MS-ring/collar protein FliF [Campylobacter pinnipediorum]AQW83534.1 flagellar MS-ring protein [Campylobacter pinnipediorum subsp. pinnipediorum]OPA79903.1 flagellar M-ring protein FliF [Campylobacter pinnipediorum subsp. pinnipediorum]